MKYILLIFLLVIQNAYSQSPQAMFHMHNQTPPACSGGVQTSGCGGATTMTDARDGKVYNIVQTGTGTDIQCWMAQNLNYGTYEALPSSGAQPPGYKYCQNLAGLNDATCPLGGLYEWANMMNGSVSCNGDATCPPCTTPVKGLCPTGWHIPSHYEWTLLEKNVGSNPGAFPYDITTNAVWLGTNEGSNLKQTGTSNWTAPNTGATNITGFTGLPAGYSWSGMFGTAGGYCAWWSATESGFSAWRHGLGWNFTQVYRDTYIKTDGFSVRCVKDCSAPTAPTATAATGITSTSFSANWLAVSGATTYYLDVSTDTAFGSYLTGYNNLNLGNVLTSSVTSVTCGGLYYRVKASNACATGANSNYIIVNTNITDARDGKTYSTVLIGTQCWMAQNLNYGTYVSIATGQGTAGTKYCYNDNTANCTTYGGLYEWTNMMNGSATCNGTGAPPNDRCATVVKGLCPSGWHVPSHYEWTTLEKNVGSNPGAFPYDITTTGWLGTNEGGNLKQTGITNWNPPNTGATNTSGFTAIQDGYSSGGSFWNIGGNGYWWSATGSGTSAWSRHLYYNLAQVYRSPYIKSDGFSVRCVKD